jgi:hypothetical protein
VYHHRRFLKAVLWILIQIFFSGLEKAGIDPSDKGKGIFTTFNHKRIWRYSSADTFILYQLNAFYNAHSTVCTLLKGGESFLIAYIYSWNQVVLRIRIRDGQKIRIRIRDEQPGSFFRGLRNNFLG